MDSMNLLGSALGLGFLAGIRLYATVLLIGLMVRFHVIAFPANLSNLNVLGNNWVLAIATFAFVMEFVADKIPWVDSLWDSVHTAIRPIGAFLLGATALGTEDPVTRTVIALLCGGVAFTAHSSKAATRLLANHVPEPFTNIGLSFAGDIFVPVGLWIVFKHPIIALGSVALFVIMFVWFAPPIFRCIRVECLAIGSLIAEYFTSPPDTRPSESVRCSAARGVKGLVNSIGELRLEPGQFVFTTRRMFRKRTHRVPLNQVGHARFYRGLFVDTLTVTANDYDQVFDVFKIHPELQPEWLRRLAKARGGFPATSS
jgi:hypothetical protein